MEMEIIRIGSGQQDTGTKIDSIESTSQHQRAREKSASLPEERQKGKYYPHKLNLHNLKYNFITIKILGWLNILPFDIDLSNSGAGAGAGKISAKPTKLNAVNWLWNIFVTIRLLILNLAALGASTSKENDSIHLARLFLLLILAFILTFFFINYVNSIVLQKVDHITLFNGLLKYLQEKEGENEGQHEGHSLKNRPIYDLYLIFIPPIVYPMALVPVAITIMDPESPMLLSSWVVETMADGALVEGTLQIHSVSAYIILTILDLLFWFVIISFQVYIVFVQCLYPTRIKEELQRALQSLKMARMRNQEESTDFGVEEAATSLKRIKLLMLLANGNQGFGVYIQKLTTLHCSILSEFVAIKMLHMGNVPLGLMFLFLGLEPIVAFIMFFDKAHEIPEKTERLKREILRMATARSTTGSTSTSTPEARLKVGLLKRELWSVQRLGVQCGSFCMMEREATLIFLGFVVNQIVSLLLVFK